MVSGAKEKRSEIRIQGRRGPGDHTRPDLKAPGGTGQNDR